MSAAASACNAMHSRLAAWRERALQLAEARLPALTRYRRAEPLPIELHRRRIYVLPTHFGLGFGLMLATMLLGALNFNNNAALLLTFMIAGAVLISLHATVRNLDRLRLTAVQADPAHAGASLRIELRFVPDDGRARERLEVALAGTPAQRFDLGAEGSTVTLATHALRRGWRPVGRLTLATQYPFGLFRAWSVLHPQRDLLVLARAEAGHPPLPSGGGHESERRRAQQGEDWSGLRDYRSGDARRLIAWKASARQERLLVKELQDPSARHLVFDHAQTGLTDPERRIERLTRWVIDASSRQLGFTLLLPGRQLGPDRGAAHRAQCLRDLALLP
jgi:uncharacterized protein (DUF58 family)